MARGTPPPRTRVENSWDVVFPSQLGMLRDRSNTNSDIREALDPLGFGWVTTHTFRKTTATLLDESGLTVREIADQLGHTRVSVTQDTYFGRHQAAPTDGGGRTHCRRPAGVYPGRVPGQPDQAVPAESPQYREYIGLIWIDDQPGIRFQISACSLEDARNLLLREYGKGHVISLWNEQDAARPR
jgi:hypothetical protein